MNPLDVSNNLRNRYVSYLTTTFGLHEEYRQLHQEFEGILYQPNQLITGPFLEATAPYKVGEATISSLIRDQVLHEGFVDLLLSTEAVLPTSSNSSSGFGKKISSVQRPPRRERLPGDRRLYLHQETALRRLCRLPDQLDIDRHTVVASGTGSGKTECFLLPAIDWVLRHPNRAPGSCGIRVLLVYPMNALVNDQIRRLRSLIGFRKEFNEKRVPITFARYTSETQQNSKDGKKKDPAAPDNQLLGRDEIVDSPPDILITNFAMLEQALLRPQESPFFNTVDEFSWRFLILDEAHSYRGAQAIELARLMQRLRAAIRRGKEKSKVTWIEPVCVATSATLTSGNMSIQQRKELTAEFAGTLFGHKFQPESVLFAEREDPTGAESCWTYHDEQSEARADRGWVEIPDPGLEDLGLPPDDKFTNSFRDLAPEAVFQEAKTTSADRRAFLFHLLRKHPRFHWLWEKIKLLPAKFEDLAEAAVWAGESDKRVISLERLISCCNVARRLPGEQSLLPCRYHLFASALEGLFVELASDGEIDNSQNDMEIPELGIRKLAVRRLQPKDRQAFEVAYCRGCGIPMVVTDPNSRQASLDQPPVWDRPVQIYSFRSDQTGALPLKSVRIDLKSGKQEGQGSSSDPKWRTLFKIPANPKGTDVAACPNCSRPSRHYVVASRFLTGQDAPVSVLTEALYGQMPVLSPAKCERLKLDYPHRFHSGADPVVGGGRKLLIFSDSRQNAAFMASYLQDHSVEFLVREFAYNALSRGGLRSLSLTDWTNLTIDLLNEKGILVPYLEDRDLSQLEGSPFAGSYLTAQTARTKRISYSLLADIQGTQPLSLETLGLAKIGYGLEGIDFLEGDDLILADDIADWPGRPLGPWELKELLVRIFSLMRRQYLMTTPPGVDRPGFGTNQHFLVCEKPQESSENLHGLWNAGGQDTVYVDLLKRWCLRRSGKAASDSQLRSLISWIFKGIWESLKDQVVNEIIDGVPAIALNHDSIRVYVADNIYRCDKCGSFTSSHLHGICPEPRCNGDASEISNENLPSKKPDSNLFVARYLARSGCELRCEEHTAQLNAEVGQNIQEAFQCGQVNVLSCSTTFEMGIDLGDLQSIVLRNMPPSTANYLQRAGRAGRRSDSVAFVLTFCQRRPHDRHYFHQPEKMIAGEIRPPKIDIGNERILQRHCFAEILSAYWEWLDSQSISGGIGQFRISGNVGLFFDDIIDSIGQTPSIYLRTWLSKPEFRSACSRRLVESFDHLKADGLAEKFLDLIVDPDEAGPNPLARAAREATQILYSFREGMDKHLNSANFEQSKLSAMNGPGDLDSIESIKASEKSERELYYSFDRLLKQQRREFLISFLMGRGVLPSFAFPVNVVKLHVLGQELREGAVTSRLKLERDGKIGLGDYAPKSRVVAGKHVYKSVGLRKFPALQFNFTEWYRWCPSCNHIQLWTGCERVSDAKPECQVCGNPLPPGSRAPRQWVQPVWGYVTDRTTKPEKPRGQRPYRLFTTRSFFIAGRPQQDGSGDGSHVELEKIPNFFSPISVEASSARGRSLLVLNLGEFETKSGILQRSGFKVCSKCGRSVFDQVNQPNRHRAPYHKSGRSCTGPIGLGPNAQNQPVALGHRYETDVIWLDFYGTNHQRIDTGFWLSLAYALTNGAAEELNVERADLEATTVPIGGDDRQAIVIYDTVPGGAGHTRQILHNLPAIIRRARDLLADCDCDPKSTGCYGCLCDYYNQFAHGELSRGPALEYLSLMVDQLDQEEPTPWRQSKLTPYREMVDSLLTSQGTVSIWVQSILPGVLPGLNRDWFDFLKEVAIRPTTTGQVTLNIEVLPQVGKSTGDTLASQRLAELQSLGVKVHASPKALPKARLDIGGDQDGVTWKWDWLDPLGPDIKSAQRSRIKRTKAARGELGDPGSGTPVAFEQLRQFHHFALRPGLPQDPFAAQYLGKILLMPVERLFIIDPFLLHGPQDARRLDNFLSRLRPHVDTQVCIKASPTDGKQFNFRDQNMQIGECRKLEAKHAKLNLRIRIATTYKMEEHDRIMLGRVRDDNQQKCYRILLGQGLFGFEAACRRYSEGIWFEMTEKSFETDWQKF